MKNLSQQSHSVISLTTNESECVAGAGLLWDMCTGGATAAVGFGLTYAFFPIVLPYYAAGTALYAGAHALNDFRKKLSPVSAVNVFVDKAAWASIFGMSAMGARALCGGSRRCKKIVDEATHSFPSLRRRFY